MFLIFSSVSFLVLIICTASLDINLFVGCPSLWITFEIVTAVIHSDVIL